LKHRGCGTGDDSVARDYLGQKSVSDPSPSLHPYRVGEATAVAVWDAVRTSQQRLAGDGSSAAFGPIALWGASQGGHGALRLPRPGRVFLPPNDTQHPIDLSAERSPDTLDARLAGTPATGECLSSPAQTCANTP